MDGAGCKPHSQIQKDAIISAIRNGELSAKEIERRMNQMIDDEIQKEQPDLALIGMCQDLVWEIMSPVSYPDDLEAGKQAFLRKKARESRVKQRTVRWCAAAVMVMMIFVGGVIGQKEWLGGQSSDDEQQYVINASNVDPGIVHKGNAELKLQDQGEVVSADLEDIFHFLGYAPAYPKWLPESVAVQEHYASKSFASDDLRTDFQIADGYLMYSFTRYLSAVFAGTAYEQNAKGKKIVQGGTTYYCTQNIGDIVLVWFDGMDCYSLSGTVQLEDALKIAASTATD